MDAPLLSVVIPLDFGQRATQLLCRTVSLATALGGQPFEIVIAHNDRSGLHDELLQGWSRRYAPHAVRLVSGRYTSHRGHQGLLRNRGVAQARSDVVLFLDADIYPDARLFTALARQVHAGAPMAMAPCVYLTAGGTRRLVQTGKTDGALTDYLNRDRKRALHLAQPSSVMAVRRGDYALIGGFDECYHGHGYEDFDFMMRFAHRFNLVAPGADVFVDESYRAPLMADGFRAMLAQIALPNLLDRLVALHLYHDNQKEGAYRTRRAENAVLFQKVLATIYGPAGTLQGLSCRSALVERFRRECASRAIAPEKFIVLTDDRPGHVGRGFSIRRQVRRLKNWAAQ